MSKRRNPYARPDARTLAAKARGYPARSVFKLEEIDRRVGLLKSGQRVLDLGAAPGSWSRFALERVGPAGRVVAVDTNALELAGDARLEFLRADVFELGPEVLSARGPYGVVLSDMAPATSGSKVADQAQSLELFLRALGLARQCGAPGSSFVGKLFMGPDFSGAKRALAEAYRTSRVLRPAGTRRQSSEVFLVGLGLSR
jgi:23S rRNA (uridine2552-2'-O)-methyltransferase